MKIFSYEIFKVRSRRERERERERVVVKPQQQDKIYIFDFVRAFACFYIVLHHFLFIPLQNYYHAKFTVTGIGMEMFFFTTGFLIPLSLERCNWKQFAVKRCFRLLPVLAFAVLTCVIVSQLGIIQTHVNLRSILRTLTMTSDIIKIKSEKLNIIVGFSWSMQVELKFYIIAAVAFFFGKTMREKFFVLCSLVLLYYVFTYIFKLPKNFPTSGYCFKLVSGCLLGAVYYFYKYKHLSKVEFFFWAIVCIFLVYFAADKTRRFSYVIGCVFVLCFAHFFTNKGNNKVVKYLANLSYSIYLFHVMPRYYLNKHHPIDIQSFSDIIILFGYRMLLFIPIFIACHFIYYYIEKPAYDFGRRLASRIH